VFTPFPPLNRDICDSLRIIETLIPSTGSISEAEALDIYRRLYQQSGPVLRLLQSLLMVLSRAAAEHRSGGVAGHYPILPVTFLLLYPVLRGILMLPHTMPGTEHTFHLLDRYIFTFHYFCCDFTALTLQNLAYNCHRDFAVN